MTSRIEVARDSVHSSDTGVAPRNVPNFAPSTSLEDEERPSSHHTVSPQEEARTSNRSIDTGENDRPLHSPITALEENAHPFQLLPDDKQEDGPPASSSVPEEEDETQYPNKLNVALIMLALYLSGFLVALVMPPTATSGQTRMRGLISPAGSDNHRHRNSSHHRPVPFSGRCQLVRLRVYADR